MNVIDHNIVQREEKPSRIYFYMLNKLFRDYPKITDKTITHLATEVNRYFNKLLLLPDNDLSVYEGFNHEEVLRICRQFAYELELPEEVRSKEVPLSVEEIDWLTELRPPQEDIDSFKELLPAIKEYVAARYSQNTELRTKE